MRGSYDSHRTVYRHSCNCWPCRHFRPRLVRRRDKRIAHRRFRQQAQRDITNTQPVQGTGWRY